LTIYDIKSIYVTMVILTQYDILSSKKSAYFFYSAIVKSLIEKRGGMGEVAEKLNTTSRTLYRTVNNKSRNGRLQRDICRFLRRPMGQLGYIQNPDPNLPPEMILLKPEAFRTSTEPAGQVAA